MKLLVKGKRIKFYAAHCDFFVVMDKRLKAKSRVLYEEFDIWTKIVDPEEFASMLPELLLDNQLTATIKNKRKTEPVDSIVENGVHKVLFRLKNYPFSYFTHVQYEMEDGVDVLLFTKMYDNWSNFIFIQEYEQVIEDIHSYFGNDSDLENVQEKFNSENKDDHCQMYSFENGAAQLSFFENKFYLCIYLRDEQRQEYTDE